MRMMYCGYSFLRRSNFPTTKQHDGLEKIKNGNFTLFSHEGALSYTIFKKNVSPVQTYLFPAVIRFVFRVFLEIWIAVPKSAIFHHFDGVKVSQTATFATFYNVVIFFLCFVCLFVVVVAFLHRVRPHVALVVDEVEHQADVIIVVFNPTPEKFRPAFFSAVQIYDFIIQLHFVEYK